MCRNTAKQDLLKLNSSITKRDGLRRDLVEYASNSLFFKAENLYQMALKNGDNFIEKLQEIDKLFEKIIANSGDKSYKNMIGAGLTATPRKTLIRLLDLYLEFGSTLPSQTKEETATGEEKILEVA
ncbi:hypothetical protein CSB11_00245 [Candidatus Campbellbacteria bacterium]|nr:MAG: hypothetical protein CSB11_00245 [Candidatus Campbellbacteria bacterium]